jgi:hypothetical protein
MQIKHFVDKHGLHQEIFSQICTMEKAQPVFCHLELGAVLPSLQINVPAGMVF